jgi:uncharacterized protein (DUF362 family)
LVYNNAKRLEAALEKGMLYINYGADLAKMAAELLEASGVGGMVERGMRVAIKPNLVNPSPASEGATTHPEAVEGIIQFLQGRGIRDIRVIESAWVAANTTRAFKVCGYERLESAYGVRLLDMKTSPTRRVASHGLELEVCEEALDADFLVNVPVLKGHLLTGVTCAMKNLKGVIPDREKRRFHALGLHRPIAALAAAIQPQVQLVDAWCPDPQSEEGGHPVYTGRLVLGFDPVLTDSYAAGQLGLDAANVGYIAIAEGYGLGSRFQEGETRIVELNEQAKLESTARLPSRAYAGYKKLVLDDGACSACYAALLTGMEKCAYRGPEKVRIGQGYKGKAMDGIGVGKCCQGATRHLAGCPPAANKVAGFLSMPL